MAARPKPAKTEREWWALLKSKEHPFIRSMADWKAAIADPVNNPLKGCDAKTIARFTKSLKFAHGGLAHVDYTGVDEQLSYRQFSDLWGRFGLGMGLFTDHEHMHCLNPGTCGAAMHSICTSNC